MNLTTNGSLVEARQNPVLYKIILIMIAILAVFFVIGIVLKYLRSMKSSSKWLDANKDKPTTQKNITEVATIAKLDIEEKKMLTQVCQHFKPKNIVYLLREDKAMVDLFKQEYDALIKKDVSSDKISTLFSTLYKLETAHNNLTVIKTIKALSEGQTFTYTDSKKKQWSFKLNRNEPETFVLNIPREFAKSEIKPPALSKVVMTFKTESGVVYAVETRVIRYEEEKTGMFVLIASSSSKNRIIPVQRRNARRHDLNCACTFAAVKELKEKAKSSGKKEDFEILPKKYDGKLQNISSGGCRMSCGLPIKGGQYLYLDLFNGSESLGSALGYIVMTNKSSDGKQFILHIKFTDIDIETINKISALVYGFSGETTTSESMPDILV